MPSREPGLSFLLQPRERERRCGPREPIVVVVCAIDGSGGGAGGVSLPRGFLGDGGVGSGSGDGDGGWSGAGGTEAGLGRGAGEEGGGCGDGGCGVEVRG